MKLFFRGFATVFPVVLTVYLAFWILNFFESLLRSVILLFLPANYYVEGLGILSSLAVIMLIGILMSAPIMRRLIKQIEVFVRRAPVIGTIYGSTRDFLEYFSQDKFRSLKLALVKFDDLECSCLGFVTSTEPEKALGKSVADHVAVYLPMSYQIGGFTVFVPAKNLKNVDLPVEDALGYTFTAGLSWKGKAKA